jgi:recombination protein U
MKKQVNNYKIRSGKMGYWNNRGLRGNTFEDMINVTNENYNLKKLAIVQKIPTPIKPITIDNKSRTITLAYFEQKSTVDYIGAVQGIPICFDAKETSEKNLPLKNIHQHQMDFMQNFSCQKGIAFIIVRFSAYNEMYLLQFEKLKIYWEVANNGGRKSIPYTEFDKNLIIKSKSGFLVHYLEAVNLILN